MRWRRRFLTLLTTFLCTALLLPQQSALAVDYTVTYDGNANKVGSYTQAGLVTGSVASVTQASGSTVTVAAQGNLARQGFTFAGWNTAADGTGISYTAGTATFTLTGNTTLYAKWTVPVAARLIGNGGSMISVVNTNSVTNGSYCLSAGVRGITSDGTDIYFRPSTYLGYICRVTSAGVIVSVNAVSGLAAVGADSISLVYGNGCLFLRKDSNSTLNSIWCIALSDWSMTSISLPAGYNMPAGGTWLYGNLVQFPDGRIGSIGTSVAAASWSGGVGTGAGQCPTGMYCKTIRLYSVTGSGSTVAVTFSTDFILADYEVWPSDDHGIATDGTYLYQIHHASGYKVWALRSDGPSFLVFNAAGSGACGANAGTSGTYCQITYPVDGSSSTSYAFGNGTYLGRSHGLQKYLIGDYLANSKFWLSDPATPPPGPGFPASSLGAPSITGTVYKGVVATISITSNLAGIVRFFVGGKRISTCKDRATSGTYPNFTVSCSWKPPVTGKQVVTATLTPTSNLFSAVTNTATYWVVKRTTTR